MEPARGRFARKGLVIAACALAALGISLAAYKLLRSPKAEVAAVVHVIVDEDFKAPDPEALIKGDEVLEAAVAKLPPELARRYPADRLRAEVQITAVTPEHFRVSMVGDPEELTPVVDAVARTSVELALARHWRPIQEHLEKLKKGRPKEGRDGLLERMIGQAEEELAYPRYQLLGRPTVHPVR